MKIALIHAVWMVTSTDTGVVGPASGREDGKNESPEEFENPPDEPRQQAKGNKSQDSDENVWHENSLSQPQAAVPKKGREVEKISGRVKN
jgi:hypothetical protein